MTVKDLITRHEGRKRWSYRDQDGHWTIGVGHNLDADPLPPELYEPDGSLSDATIDEVLEDDISNATVAVRRLCDPWYLNIDAVRQAVLIDMAFEMGFEGLRSFQQFLGCVAATNYAAASEAMMASLWATKQVPTRAAEDALMMRTGAWPA
jgi:lysozyme